MNQNTQSPFVEEMQVTLNSLSGETISVRYGTFKQFEDLLLEYLDDGLDLEVKLSSCQCANLDCHVCKADWEFDKWIPFDHEKMSYISPTVEGQGAVYIYDIREAISSNGKEEAVEILKGLGYTLKQGCKWKPPLGTNRIQTAENITKHILEELYKDEDAVPHDNYLLAFADDLIEMVETGLSAKELRQKAKDTPSE